MKMNGIPLRKLLKVKYGEFSFSFALSSEGKYKIIIDFCVYGILT